MNTPLKRLLDRLGNPPTTNMGPVLCVPCPAKGCDDKLKIGAQEGGSLHLMCRRHKLPTLLDAIGITLWDLEPEGSPRRRPEEYRFCPENIPAELKERRQWVNWGRYGSQTERELKHPWCADAGGASSTDPKSWSTFDKVLAAVQCGMFMGLGYVFSEDDPYIGIDLDKVICADDDARKARCEEVRSLFPGAYCEISPSGKGLHIIVQGKLDGSGRKEKTGPTEIYDRARYFTVTGNINNPAGGGQILDFSDAARQLWEAIPAPHMSTLDLSQTDAEEGSGNNKERCWKYIQKMSDAVSGEGGHAATFKAACICFEFGLDPASALEVMQKFNDEKTAGEPWSDRELGHKLDTASRHVREKGTFGSKGGGGGNGNNSDGGGKSGGNGGGRGKKSRMALPELRWELTDKGNAEKLVRKFGQDIRYCKPLGGWMAWDGTLWRQDADGLVAGMVHSVCEDLQSEALAETDDEAKEFRINWAQQSAMLNHLNAMSTVARHRLETDLTVFDKNLWIANAPNGIIDITNGKLGPHRREEYCTLQLPVPYDPNAKCPLWDNFVSWLFKGDVGLINYIQRLAGYSLLGVTDGQILPILHGSGQNGKSTFLNALMGVMGDYALKAPTVLMLNSRNADTESQVAKASLFGKRLVICIETGEGKKLNEAVIKELTGSDKICARRLYKGYFEFWPTHTPWLATNHEPIAQGTDLGLWRRLRLIPFHAVVKEEDKDGRFGARLVAEYPGILRWLVVGAMRWLKDGFQEPEPVTRGTAEYRDQMDAIGLFIQAECIHEPGNDQLHEQARRLYLAYRVWCESEGFGRPKSNPAFGKRLTDLGVGTVHTRTGKVRTGIQISQFSTLDLGAPSRIGRGPHED